jgi:hypothetical protein
MPKGCLLHKTGRKGHYGQLNIYRLLTRADNKLKQKKVRHKIQFSLKKNFTYAVNQDYGNGV